MDYREMRGIVLDAYRREDYALCFSLVERFIESADGRDRGRALSFKASLISQADHRRAAEGLMLVEEALPLVQDNPEVTLHTLVTALALCFAIGDVGRASTYELLSHRLLHEHRDDACVCASQYRLHLNLGMLASFRGEHATAYWHFMQGTTSLLAAGAEDGSDGSSWLFWLYLRTATACLRMGRLPEAEEALERAHKLAGTATQRQLWAIDRAELLRQHGMFHEATAVLAQAKQPSCEAWDAETRTRLLITQALLAQDVDDLHGFHRHLSEALQEAAAHSLDFLLCDIQRIQRGRFVHPNPGG